MGIPRKLYAHIERRLYDRDYAEVAKACQGVIDSRSDAFSLKSPLQGGGGRSAGVSDRVQNGVERVITAEERLSRALRWQTVFKRLDEAFAGTQEERVAQLIYCDRVQIQQIAQLMNRDRQTITRLRDNYVTHAALLAAEAGLIRMREFLEEGDSR